MNQTPPVGKSVLASPLTHSLPLDTMRFSPSAAAWTFAESRMSRTEIQHELTYFKRFRMQRDLLAPPLPAIPPLPEGYAWIEWEDHLLETHARTKVRCFVDEVDGVVFPNLSHFEGCMRLMRQIRSKSGFRPQSTWLIAYHGEGVATVQGVGDRTCSGAIQNLGVVAEHRGRGLGAALLLRALHGFRSTGLQRAVLEVTAQNDAAVRLYRKFGFKSQKTIYKVMDPIQAISLPIEADWVL